jgi:hypothetical protein
MAHSPLGRSLPALALAFACAAAPPPGAGLTVRLLPGTPPVLVLEDATGSPAANALVTLIFSPDAPSALFASGMRTEAIRTDEKGRIRLGGLQWVGGPGRTPLRLVADHREQRVELSVELEVPAPQKAAVRGGGGSRKFLWIALAAGGAAGALAAGGSSGGSRTPASPAAPPAAIIAPAIGTPVITVTPP